MGRATAKNIIAAINANVDAWYADRISYAIFHARQLELWGLTEGRERLAAAVCTGLRGQIGAATSGLRAYAPVRR